MAKDEQKLTRIKAQLTEEDLTAEEAGEIIGWLTVDTLRRGLSGAFDDKDNR